MANRNSTIRLSENAADFEDETSVYHRGGPRRKATESGDALVGIIETLNSEHRYIHSLLDTLEKQAAKLKPGKIPDYHLLLDIVDYLTHYPDEYHHPREDLLFAEMLERDRTFKSKLDRLLREHETLHHYNDELFTKLTRIVNGGPADRPDLALRIQKFIAGYRHHMEYESREIFPMAKGTLTAGDLAKLSKKTRYLDDPLFGNEIKYQYRRLGRNVQTRIGAASAELVAREFSAMESGIGKLSEQIDALGQLRTTVKTLTKKSWREQRATIRAHTNFNWEPNIMLLPIALLRNHGRHLQQGLKEIKEVLEQRKEKHEKKS